MVIYNILGGEVDKTRTRNKKQALFLSVETVQQMVMARLGGR